MKIKTTITKRIPGPFKTKLALKTQRADYNHAMDALDYLTAYAYKRSPGFRDISIPKIKITLPHKRRR